MDQRYPAQSGFGKDTAVIVDKGGCIYLELQGEFSLQYFHWSDVAYCNFILLFLIVSNNNDIAFLLLSTIGGLVLFVSPTPQKNVPTYASIRFGLLLKTSKRFKKIC